MFIVLVSGYYYYYFSVQYCILNLGKYLQKNVELVKKNLKKKLPLLFLHNLFAWEWDTNVRTSGYCILINT